MRDEAREKQGLRLFVGMRDSFLQLWIVIGLRTFALILLAGSCLAFASVVGTDQSAESITRVRIAHPPRAERNPGGGPIWSRFYLTGTESPSPIFADRDKSIPDNVNELSAERQNGDKRYSSNSQLALDRF